MITLYFQKMTATISHVILIVLYNMKLLEFASAPDFTVMISKLLPIAMQELSLDRLPHIKLVKELGDKEQPSFGCYAQGENTLYLALNNRHPVDILRTCSHELVHYKQDLDDRLDDTSGDTGSDIENEANAVAGVIMRNFNKAYPSFLLADTIDIP